MNLIKIENNINLMLEKVKKTELKNLLKYLMVGIEIEVELDYDLNTTFNEEDVIDRIDIYLNDYFNMGENNWFDTHFDEDPIDVLHDMINRKNFSTEIEFKIDEILELEEEIVETFLNKMKNHGYFKNIYNENIEDIEDEISLNEKNSNFIQTINEVIITVIKEHKNKIDSDLISDFFVNFNYFYKKILKYYVQRTMLDGIEIFEDEDDIGEILDIDIPTGFKMVKDLSLSKNGREFVQNEPWVATEFIKKIPKIIKNLEEQGFHDDSNTGCHINVSWNTDILNSRNFKEMFKQIVNKNRITYFDLLSYMYLRQVKNVMGNDREKRGRFSQNFYEFLIRQLKYKNQLTEDVFDEIANVYFNMIISKNKNYSYSFDNWLEIRSFGGSGYLERLKDEKKLTQLLSQELEPFLIFLEIREISKKEILKASFKMKEKIKKEFLD